MKPKLGQLNAIQKDDKARARIPNEYQEFLPMFRKEPYKKLPKHQYWDYNTPIKEEKKPTYGPIYAHQKLSLRSYKST